MLFKCKRGTFSEADQMYSDSIAKVRKWDDTYLIYGFFFPDDQIIRVF